MFCVHCGKPVVDNASFCAFCGKAINQPAESMNTNPVNPIDVEWEYNLFNQYWERGKGGRWNLGHGVTEYSVRLDNWGSDQNWLMPKIQKYLDKGWQYVNPPGPNSYTFIIDTDSEGGVNFNWLSVSNFVVEFRRPAKPLKEIEKQLVGSWQETTDPNAGFWNTFGNIVFSQKLTVKKYTFEFRKDHTFSRFNRNGKEVSGGVFFEDEKGKINLFYKFTPEDDVSISIIENKLTAENGKLPRDFERVNQ